MNVHYSDSFLVVQATIQGERKQAPSGTFKRFLQLQLLGRHLVGVWIGGVWNGHFPDSKKYFSEAEISRKMP